MENLRIIKFFAILIGGMLLLALAIPLFVLAYNDEKTHPALTDEIVDHFNRFYPKYELSVSQKELVKQGSIDEDSGVRWLWHFYDPIKNRGLVFGNDDLLRNPELAAIIGGSRSEWSSSKEWAQDTSAQAGLLDGSAYGSIFSFFSSQSDFSWERAIYEYAWGDKNRAMLALGHILHLIEDASVPDHTRNDPHPHITEWSSILNESPYEIWTKRFTDENFSTEISTPPVILGSLNEYFDSMARYSNGNFFSKDTIESDDYIKPIYNSVDFEKLSDGQFYKFGYSDIDGDKYRLMLLGRRQFGSTYLINSLEDTDRLILTDYWSHLSRQAILHGAGVTKLFFDEVAREQKTKELYNKNRSWLQKIGDGIAGIWAGFTNNTSSSAGLLATMLDVSPPMNTAAIDVSPPEGGEISTTAGEETSTATVIGVSPPAGGEASTSPENALRFNLLGEVEHGTNAASEQNPPLVFLAGGAGPRRETDNQQLTTDNPTPPDTTPPDAPIITAPTATPQTTSRITFSGTAETNAEIVTDFNSATTTVIEVSPPDGGETSTTTGAWSLALELPQGTTTINFFAKDNAGNISTGTAKTLFVDSDAPGIVFSIIECAASFSPDGCLIATTTLTLAWSSNAQDIAAITLACVKDGDQPCANFSYDPTATSTTFIAENNHTYTFTVTARDISGNESQTEPKTIEIRTAPVVINEIAWAGTQANEQDEWIELKNISGYPIDLAGWLFYSQTDNKPYIDFSEAAQRVIQPNGYYLIERTDDETVSDISADWFGSFGATTDGGSGISNIGETFILAYGSTTIDQTPAINSCGRRRWCGGDVLGKKTSERIDPFITGTNLSNWVTNNGVIKNGKDTAGNGINGTPKARNSANYAIASLRSVRPDDPEIVLTKNNSPYLILSEGLTIYAGQTLALEPGTVVKFVDTQSPSFFVNGTLKAEGTAEDPVVFTSMYDDEYGGDTNNDGICNPSDASSTAACPFAGSWKQIVIQPTSDNSIFDHAIIRYGGRWFNIPQAFRAMLAVDGAEIQLTNSLLEHSWGHGLRLVNSDSVIENNMFRRNTVHDNDTGFFIGGGSPTIRGNVSSYNSIGGLISNIGGIFSDNIFSNNIHEALLVSGAIPVMTNSAALANGANGILLQSIPSDFSFQRGLPYIIEGQPILSLGNYTFEAGAVLKFKTSSSAMTFAVPVNIAGTGANLIVFTSIDDDAYGGDTNNDGVCNPAEASSTAVCPYAGSWRGLKFSAGANGSTLNNIIVRWGGSHSDWAGIKADGASIAIQNSVIEKNNRKGIWLLHSASTTITDTIISNHKKPDNDPNASGLYLAGSHADIGGLTFRDNTVGINVADFATGGSSVTITAPLDIDDSNTIKTIPAGLAP